ncbi:hypothetical protein CALCODRAFT_485945 [Calocera cornea HHB12733]|uniref:Uncharacterized protein n=1 Tax=Calocera cornea HHB12733 TaxID=1353952 RepID=A0A165E1W0_9BASI|nr:hypothetical protein CALCODRAFT_485945 [Calocera cornea HHB12733]
MAPATRTRTGTTTRNKENVAPTPIRSMVPDAPAEKMVKRKALRAPTGEAQPVTKKTKANAKDPHKLLGDDLPAQYRIWAPWINQNWEDESSRPKPMNLKLAPSAGTGQHLWGAFHFQVVEGVMRGGPPPTKVGDTWEFRWRGNETGEGEIICEEGPDDLRGTITFLGAGKIKGTITGNVLSEEVDFTGRKLKLPITSKTVKAWKGIWRTSNDMAMDMRQDWKGEVAMHGFTRHMELQYGRALDMCGEPPADSDTSADGS